MTQEDMQNNNISKAILSLDRLRTALKDLVNKSNEMMAAVIRKYDDRKAVEIIAELKKL